MPNSPPRGQSSAAASPSQAAASGRRVNRVALEIAEGSDCPEVSARRSRPSTLRPRERRPAESEDPTRAQALRIGPRDTILPPLPCGPTGISGPSPAQPRSDRRGDPRHARCRRAPRRRGDHRNWREVRARETSWVPASAGEWNEAIALGSRVPGGQARRGAGLSSWFPAETLIWIEVERGNLGRRGLSASASPAERLSDDYRGTVLGRALAFAAIRPERTDVMTRRSTGARRRSPSSCWRRGSRSRVINALAEAAGRRWPWGTSATCGSFSARCRGAARRSPAPGTSAHRRRARGSSRCAAAPRATRSSPGSGGHRGFRELGMPFWLAVTLTSTCEWLTGQERAVRDAEPVLDEARADLRAARGAPWLERLDAVGPPSEVLTG